MEKVTKYESFSEMKNYFQSLESLCPKFKSEQAEFRELMLFLQKQSKDKK